MSLFTTSTTDASERAEQYLIQGIKFVGERIASAYIRAKDRLVNPAPGKPSPTPEEIEACREMARGFNYWKETTGLDIDPDRVTDNLCGIQGSVTPSEKKISELADLHGIDRHQAADMYRANRLAMLAQMQAKNLHKAAAYAGWLADMDKFGVSEESDTRAEVDSLIAGCILEQYRKAAEFQSVEGRYLVESYAKQFGVNLPSWASVLPKWGEAQSKQLESIQRRQAEVLEHRAEQAREAEFAMVEQFGEF